MVFKRFLLFFLFVSGVSLAQLTVSNNAPYQNANNLVNNLLLSTSSGGAASNVTLSAGNGAQIGYFNGTSSNLGINEGMLLSTNGIGVASPANDGLTGGSSSVTDPDLKHILTNIANTNKNLYNTVVLEFDFVAGGTEIEFEYVFASNEYSQYTCSDFNDVFGFFLSGPGISGPYTNNAKNIALVPDPSNPASFTSTPVMINTVNSGSASSGGQTNPSFCENIDPNWESYSSFFVNNSSVGTVGFNGFTKPFKAKSAVICGQTYHIKLAICDVHDELLNSAVFFKKESFQVGEHLALGIQNQVDFIKCVDHVIVDPLITGGVGDIHVSWDYNGAFFSNDIVQNLTQNGVYTITVSDDCSLIEHSITVEDYTDMELSLPDTVVLCNDVEIIPELTGGAPLFEYTWTSSDFTENGSTLQLTPGFNGYVYLNILDKCDFTIKDTVYVITPEELTSSAPSLIYLCEGGVDLTGEFTGGYGDVEYYWELNGEKTYDYTISLDLSDGGIAQFHTIDECGVHLIKETEVKSPGPFEPINIDVTRTSFEICDRDIFQIPMVVSGGANGVSYQWFVDGVLVSESANYRINGSNFSEGNYSVKLILTDVCDNFEEQYFKITKIDCYLPNVFTPKGDLNNDGFYFPIGTFQSNIQLNVYNRWGLLVYSNTNYERCNSEVLENCWQGEFQGEGKQCLDGVYFYTLTFYDGSVEKGTLTLFNER